MKSYQKIERAIESVSLGDNKKVGDYEGVKSSTGTNKIANLVATINTVINKNIQLNKRVTSMEAKAQATSLSPGRGADKQVRLLQREQGHGAIRDAG